MDWEGIGNEVYVPKFAMGLRVLLVDPDTSFLLHTASLLEEASYKVTPTEFQSVALYMMRERRNKFDIVVADVKGQEMDCFAFLKRILAIKKDLTVIFIAHRRDMKLAAQAFSAGASYFLEKPFRGSEIKSIWQHVFRSRRRESLEMDEEKRGPVVVEQGTMEALAINDAISNMPPPCRDSSKNNPVPPSISDLKDKGKQVMIPATGSVLCPLVVDPKGKNQTVVEHEESRMGKRVRMHIGDQAEDQNKSHRTRSSSLSIMPQEVIRPVNGDEINTRRTHNRGRGHPIGRHLQNQAPMAGFNDVLGSGALQQHKGRTYSQLSSGKNQIDNHARQEFQSLPNFIPVEGQGRSRMELNDALGGGALQQHKQNTNSQVSKVDNQIVSNKRLGFQLIPNSSLIPQVEGKGHSSTRLENNALGGGSLQQHHLGKTHFQLARGEDQINDSARQGFYSLLNSSPGQEVEPKARATIHELILKARHENMFRETWQASQGIKDSMAVGEVSVGATNNAFGLGVRHTDLVSNAEFVFSDSIATEANIKAQNNQLEHANDKIFEDNALCPKMSSLFQAKERNASSSKKNHGKLPAAINGSFGMEAGDYCFRNQGQAPTHFDDVELPQCLGNNDNLLLPAFCEAPSNGEGIRVCPNFTSDFNEDNFIVELDDDNCQGGKDFSARF